MPKYSVAEAKNGLPGLIDRALAGEEVVITRRGKPVVEMRTVSPARLDPAAAFARLRETRESCGTLDRRVPLERFSEWLYEDEEE